MAVPDNFINLHIGKSMPLRVYIYIKPFNILKLNVAIICFLCLSSVAAQDNAQFFANPYTFNPSYAGVEGRPSFYLNYRRQWINVEGSPQVGNLSFHTPLKNFLSMGLNINNDRRGLFNTTSASLSAAYTVMLGDFKSMRFGISAGAGKSSLDLSRVTDNQDDPELLKAGNSFLQGNAGISFHIKTFHGGIALPVIFEPSNISGNPSSLNPLQTVVLHASNRFYWNRNKNLVEPHVIYRYNTVIPSQVELALAYHMNSVVWLGGSYKQHIGSSAFGGFHLNKTLGVGYAYTFKTEAGSELNSPSHEIQLTLLLGVKRKDIPFYSFVDIDKEKRVKQVKVKPANTAIAKNQPKPKPVEPKPVQPKPVETKKPEVKVAATKPVQTKPEKKPVETKPVKPKPEVKVAKTKPVETKPAETKPVETRPVETKPVVAKADPKPVEPKPVEPKKTETPVVTTPVETKKVEKKEEKKSEEKKLFAIEQPPVEENHQARLPDALTNKSEKKPKREKRGSKSKEKQTAVVQQQAPLQQTAPAKADPKKLGEMPHVHDTLHPAHEEEKEKIARLAAHAENPNEQHDEHVDFHPNAERHEFVKKGSHSEELEIGDYLVAGVFRSKVNAQHFADGLNVHGFKSDHGHLSEKNLWYVYIAHTDTIEKAKAEREKYRKLKIFRDAWLLTVHH